MIGKLISYKSSIILELQVRSFKILCQPATKDTEMKIEIDVEQFALPHYSIKTKFRFLYKSLYYIYLNLAISPFFWSMLTYSRNLSLS